MKDKVSQVLQQILEENGLTIFGFAKKLNITHTTVYHWFKDNQLPRLPYIKRICEVFGVSISRFF